MSATDELLRAVAAAPAVAAPIIERNDRAGEPSSADHDAPSEVIDIAPFELTRWELRFADPTTEQDYRSWHRRVAVPFTRAGMVAAAMHWVFAIVADS